MTLRESISNYEGLSTADKLDLLDELWIDVHEETLKNMLRERYAAYLENPADVKSWDEVKRRLEKKCEA